MKRYFNIYKLTILFAFITAFTFACNADKKAASEETVNAVTVNNKETAGESLYQLEGEWHSQNGDTLQLAELNGKIPVVSMIFTRCGFACPRIVADIKNIEKQIPAEKKDSVVFVLVSFDSERDNPDKLKEFATEMKLDDKWILLHGGEQEVRELSMLLNVKYKKQPDGSFAHSNGITLLDANGAIAAHVEGLGTDPEPIVSKMKEL
ncbi:MAG TPA: SCO family protein [Sphingobacteriaceae bacterium]